MRQEMQMEVCMLADWWGWNDGTISASYATGDADGSNYVGGLVGVVNEGGTISACYATGNADGNNNVGGLVGWNDGTISASYATGAATSTSGEKCWRTGGVE